MYFPERIILFDGVCNFCDASVQWLIKKDTKQLFRFASLQSDVGKQLLQTHHLDVADVDSIVYIISGKAYIKSTAIIYILKDLGRGWKLFLLTFIIPKRIRDFLYDQFAKRRYLLFGKMEECRLPDADFKSRFL